MLMTFFAEANKNPKIHMATKKELQIEKQFWVKHVMIEVYLYQCLQIRWSNCDKWDSTCLKCMNEAE